MRCFVLLLMLLAAHTPLLYGSGPVAMFWNVENFFDYKDGGTGTSDTEFSTQGQRHWTASRFYRKATLIAKSVYFISDRYGGMPDVIGLAEVENKRVLNKLLYDTPLRKAGYSVVHYDSPDRRGIDVALLYRSAALHKIDEDTIQIASFKTRNILSVQLEEESGLRRTYIVVHFPSKYGGRSSDGRRKVVARRLRDYVDSVSAARGEEIVVMGDFNDTPHSDCFEILRASLHCLAADTTLKGRGTIRYDGLWQLIDMFWTKSLNYEMQIVELPFLMKRDNTRVGDKPLRTYTGPVYEGGVSDHLPIVLLSVEKKY